MLIELIIEFKSRLSGPLVVHIFLKLVIFMTKQKSSKANLRVHYLMLKMLQRAMYLDFSHKIAESNVPWAKSQNLTPKCKILNVFWT